MGHRNPVRDEERELILRLRTQGLTKAEVVERTGRSGSTVDRLVAAAGGLPPRERHVREGALTAAEREEISRRLALGQRGSHIAVALGRAASTISRWSAFGAVTSINEKSRWTYSVSDTANPFASASSAQYSDRIASTPPLNIT